MGNEIKTKLVEFYDEHWYKVEDENGVNYYPSVTTKLGIVAKPYLAKWRGDIGNREADMRLFDASERGKRIHDAWWTMTMGGAVIYNPTKHPNFTEEEITTLKAEHGGIFYIVKYQDEMVQLNKLAAFLRIVKPEIIASEVIVYSHKYKEAGTIDNVFRIKEGEYLINGKKPLYLVGGVYIADLKTGNTLDDNAYMQMASYAKMWEERTGMAVAGTFGLHTGSKNKTGISGLGVNSRTLSEVLTDFDDFRNVSKMWERNHKDDKPQTYEFPAIISFKNKETK
jgi:hypothetical protein